MPCVNKNDPNFKEILSRVGNPLLAEVEYIERFGLAQTMSQELFSKEDVIKLYDNQFDNFKVVSKTPKSGITIGNTEQYFTINGVLFERDYNRENLKGLTTEQRKSLDDEKRFIYKIGGKEVTKKEFEDKATVGYEVLIELPDGIKSTFYLNLENNTISEGKNVVKLDLSQKAIEQPTQIKEGIEELFDSNPELANQVYESLGFNTTKDIKDTWINYISKKDNITRKEVLQRLDIYNPKMITVYRGEGSTVNLENSDLPDYIKKSKGRWFTKDKTVAEQYAEMQKGKLFAVQLPEELFNNISKALNLQDTNGMEALLPQELVDEKIEITTPIPQQKQEALKRYSEYLDSIFPESKVKDILKHTTPSTIDKFKTGEGRLGKGIYLASPDYKMYDKAGSNVYRAVVNVSNLKRYDVGQFNITANKNFPTQDEYSKEPQKKLQEKDMTEGIDAYVSTANTGTEYNIFEPDQIHILGTQKDIEGFKNYVAKETKREKTVEEIEETKCDITPILKTNNSDIAF
jgi:hypothetical protein